MVNTSSIGENRVYPAAAAVVAAALQLLLPYRLALRPHLLLPVLMLALVAALVLLDPVTSVPHHHLRRTISLLLTASITVANAISAAYLIDDIVGGSHRAADSAVGLLGSGTAIYLTNVIAFALWYWEFDRGGPVSRTAGADGNPDFLFPQMATAGVADASWKPEFLDYLYLSYTNATAFSPTDTMPLSRWAKMLMMLQSAVALATVAVVVARAVNVLQ